MARTVFTKYLGADVTKAVGWNDFIPNVDSWLVQEDITIVALQVGISFGAIIATIADNMYIEAMAEVSQQAVVERDGLLLHARKQQALRLVSSAPGEKLWNVDGADHAEMVYQQGLGISIKEEGYVYLNAWLNEGVAIQCTIRPWAIIYYVKGGS